MSTTLNHQKLPGSRPTYIPSIHPPDPRHVGRLATGHFRHIATIIFGTNMTQTFTGTRSRRWPRNSLVCRGRWPTSSSDPTTQAAQVPKHPIPSQGCCITAPCRPAGSSVLQHEQLVCSEGHGFRWMGFDVAASGSAGQTPAEVRGSISRFPSTSARALQVRTPSSKYKNAACCPTFLQSIVSSVKHRAYYQRPTIQDGSPPTVRDPCRSLL